MILFLGSWKKKSIRILKKKTGLRISFPRDMPVINSVFYQTFMCPASVDLIITRLFFFKMFVMQGHKINGIKYSCKLCK